jgi:hypothetical protein
MPGNNTCVNSKRNSKNTTMNRKECSNKWMVKITHSLQTLIILSMLLAVSSDFSLSLSRSSYFGKYCFLVEPRGKENFMSTCSIKGKWKYFQGCRPNQKCILTKLLILEIQKILTNSNSSNISSPVNSTLLIQDLHNEQVCLWLLNEMNSIFYIFNIFVRVKLFIINIYYYF